MPLNNISGNRYHNNQTFYNGADFNKEYYQVKIISVANTNPNKRLLICAV